MHAAAYLTDNYNPLIANGTDRKRVSGIITADNHAEKILIIIDLIKFQDKLNPRTINGYWHRRDC